MQSLSPVSIEKTGRSVIVANADGSAYQHGRRLARSLSYQEYRSTLGQRTRTYHAPAFGLEQRRWTSTRPTSTSTTAGAWSSTSTGASAARPASSRATRRTTWASWERKTFSMGREMSWLHIERYFEQEQPFVRFLPMLCQHCDSAPCESVCPVFAPHHNKEGINNQVYNRCIGTRDCNENCPWKVRRFNWFTVEARLSPGMAAQPRCHGAGARGDGEVLFLHTAHRPGKDQVRRVRAVRSGTGSSRPPAPRPARPTRLSSAT